MKTIFIILVMIIAVTSLSFSEETIFDSLDYYRVSTNYNGSAYNGRTILVYGDGGVIVRSTDGGNNWQQINLDDTYNILSVVNIGLNYYGLVNKRYIIRSTDDGISWEKYYYDIDTNSLKLLNDESSLYCLTPTRIIVYDRNVVMREEFPIKSDTNYFDFTISGRKLIYSAGHGKLGIIDLQYYEIDTSTIFLKNLGICNECPVVKNLFSDSIFTYFTLNNDLYQYNNNKAEFIFHPLKTGKYATYSSDVFEIFNITDPLMQLDSLYFIKVDKNTKKDSQIKNPGNDRYISYLKFTSLSFLSKDTIIAVGKDKLIYMSFNGGIDWQLKSHFNYSTDWGDIFLHNNYNANRISNYAKFVFSTDGGITWLPQRNYYYKYTGYGFNDPWNSGHVYFRNQYSGFVWSETDIYLDTNYAYTFDRGETVKMKNIGVNGYPLQRKIITCSNKNLTLMSFPSRWYEYAYTYIWRLTDSLDVISNTKLDSSLVLFMDTFRNDTLLAIILNLKYPREISANKWTWDSIYCSLISSIDNGMNWQKIFDFVLPNSDYIFNSINKLNDNIVFSYIDKVTDTTTSYCVIYKLNVYTLHLEKILSKEKMEMTRLGITGSGNKAFINGFYYTKTGINSELLVCDDIEKKPTDWRSISPTSRYWYHYINIKNDSLIYIIGYDSLSMSNVIWFAKPKPITSVEIQTEGLYSLYLSTPRPNPAREFTKIKIWWDQSYNIEQADIKAYNMIGQVVSDKSQFSFNRINAYSGEYEWNFGELSTGVYFIVITLGDEHRAQPVVISR